MGQPFNQPHLLSYTDYRQFLSDYYDFRRRQSSGFNFHVWSRRLGLSSPSTLRMIVARKRQAGRKVAIKLVEYFDFDADLATYFLDLVGLQKRLKDPRLTVFLLEHLKSRIFPPGPVESTDLLFQRLTYVIREMTKLKNFVNTRSWIEKRLVGHQEKQRLQIDFDALVATGLVAKNEQGRWAPQAPTPRVVPPDALKIRRLHKQLLDASEGAYDLCHESERSFLTSFLSLKRDRVSEAKKLLAEFQSRFSELVEAAPGNGDEVYQLNLHFFPATREDKNS